MNTLMLRRRLAYISAMVLLLVPLYVLGKPSVRRPDGEVLDQGGTLAQLRTQYDLGQSDLGEMDPASESMRLATLGLRGVAASILWQYAEHYKREQYWDRLSATLNQIAVLQPHFVKVWEFQAHNLSYNVSVEFDDYRQRYEWVKRGMNYLVKGSKYNKRRTEMPYELGWFFGNKLGVADEKVQFRELFRNDQDFHNEMLDNSGMNFNQLAGRGPDGKPDNWLVGSLWYERAYDMVEAGSRPARSAMMFYRMGPQWLMKYAEGIQAEGTLDDAARDAWERAGEGWNTFGNKQILTTFGDIIYLNELQLANEEYARQKQEFQEFCGDSYTQMLEARRAKLTPEQLEALDVEPISRTFDQMMMAATAEGAIDLPLVDVAKSTPEDIRVDAIRMANKVLVAKEKIRHIETYRDQINFGYWAVRCEAEQEDAAMLARTNMYEANQLLDKGELDAALAKYDVAWQAWSDLFNAFPSMMIDDAADDVVDSIERYRRLLDTPDLPEGFALSQFLKFRELYEGDLADPALMVVISDWPKRYPGRNFLDEMIRKTSMLTPEEIAARRAPDEPPPLPERGRPRDPAARPLPSEATDGAAEPTADAPAGDAPVEAAPVEVAPVETAEGKNEGVTEPSSGTEQEVTAGMPEDAPPPTPESVPTSEPAPAEGTVPSADAPQTEPAPVEPESPAPVEPDSPAPVEPDPEAPPKP